jgi:predicted MFS family arabinose efflux permease
MASFFLVLAVYLQNGRGYAPLDSGLEFLPVGVTFVITSLRGTRVGISVGGVVLALAELALAAVAGLAGWVLLIPLAAVGVGMGIVMTPLISRVLAGVDPDHAGSASGVLSTMQQIGNSLGVALIGIVFYGTLHTGYAHAFRFGMAYTATMALVVAVLVTRFPRPARADLRDRSLSTN